MLIRKIFHLGRGLEDVRTYLCNPRHYAPALPGVDWHSDPGCLPHVEVNLGHGFRARLDLEELPARHANQNLFRAVGGNMELVGMVEFFPIRVDLTEVEVTLECAFKGIGPHPKANLERFVERQLRRIVWAIRAGENPSALCGRQPSV